MAKAAKRPKVDKKADSSPNGDSSLTPKQEMFCKEYLVDLSATQAAIRAGYSEKTAGQIGEQNLKKLEIAARVKELMDARAERVEITADYVLGSLKEVVERCLQKAPVMVRQGRMMVQMKDDQGRDVWKFDSMGANTALGLLGKHLKLFTDVHQHKGKLTLEELISGSMEDPEEE